VIMDVENGRLIRATPVEIIYLSIKIFFI